MDLYSTFIVVPHTQGAQVWITQCYLQITPYLPLPRKHSPDGASLDRCLTTDRQIQRIAADLLSDKQALHLLDDSTTY